MAVFPPHLTQSTEHDSLYKQEIAYSQWTLQGRSLESVGYRAAVADVRFRQTPRGTDMSG